MPQGAHQLLSLSERTHLLGLPGTSSCACCPFPPPPYLPRGSRCEGAAADAEEGFIKPASVQRCKAAPSRPAAAEVLAGAAAAGDGKLAASQLMCSVGKLLRCSDRVKIK